MAKSENPAIEKMSYEEAYAELEQIVSALETGEQPLQEALSLFERGQKLTKHCAELLARAELKVQQLSGEELESFEEGK
jgi:exodeoxyribonuclease VII small subunit